MPIQARSVISAVRIPAHVSILKTLLSDITQHMLTVEESKRCYFLLPWSPHWGVIWGCILNAVLEDLTLPWEVSQIQQVIDTVALEGHNHPIIQHTSAVVRRRDIRFKPVGVDDYIRTNYKEVIFVLIKAYDEKRLSFTG